MWHILFSARTAAREQRLDMPPNLPVTNFRRGGKKSIHFECETGYTLA
jgi:hypothetical protein